MRGVFWPKESIMHTLCFVNFPTLGVGGGPGRPGVLSRLVAKGLVVLELVALRKVNLIFQLKSLSNATLFSTVFFACGVHKCSH